ncbi:MAG: hemolysin III family protein [Oscillospiraceae bacterium]|nr:hemolysin III family protein [Oscillospiraceae bacterium]
MRRYWEEVKIPNYSVREERLNAITHGLGAAFGIVALVLMEVRSKTALGHVTSALFGSMMILTYIMSCLYHAVPPRFEGKKVLRILDHCNVFLLVFGTYIPVTLISVGGALGWVLFGIVAFVTTVGIVLTVVDVDRTGVLQVICHLVNGWSILIGIPSLLRNAGFTGVFYMALGGVLYSLGAILYGIGSKVKYMHSVFHVFCLMGSVAHFWAIYRYVL